MEDNIYNAPKSDLSVNENKTGSPIKAVMISAAVDIFGTIIAGLLLGIVYGVVLVSQGLSPDEISSTFDNADLYSPVSIIGIILGSSISVYAGYLCAKIVNRSEYKTVAALGIISVAFSFLLGGMESALFEDVFLSLLTFICVYFGAWLHVKQKP